MEARGPANRNGSRSFGHRHRARKQPRAVFVTMRRAKQRVQDLLGEPEGRRRISVESMVFDARKSEPQRGTAASRRYGHRWRPPDA